MSFRVQKQSRIHIFKKLKGERDGGRETDDGRRFSKTAERQAAPDPAHAVEKNFKNHGISAHP